MIIKIYFIVKYLYYVMITYTKNLIKPKQNITHINILYLKINYY